MEFSGTFWNIVVLFYIFHWFFAPWQNLTLFTSSLFVAIWSSFDVQRSWLQTGSESYIINHRWNWKPHEIKCQLGENKKTKSGPFPRVNEVAKKGSFSIFDHIFELNNLQCSSSFSSSQEGIHKRNILPYWWAIHHPELNIPKLHIYEITYTWIEGQHILILDNYFYSIFS